ncbi:hypothetical protein VP1G_05844 [Cytospora mali]|uniref:Ecp2 effector protein domain-containing protein n=1 Tax=Cytospora mali TaxID=578113 RepID=A0A194V3Y9_CYTMA|nr:hypothetical protein VP1G_05844 [Valsa mali var. pyri (nom. inval.)]
MIILLASLVFAGLARVSSGTQVWYNANGQIDNVWSCGDQWTAQGVDGPKTIPTSTILAKDCESLLKNLNGTSGFWNLDHWTSGNSQYWLPLKGVETCHFAVRYNGTQVDNEEDTVYLVYSDAYSVLVALMPSRVYGADNMYFNQTSGTWSGCQPNNKSVQWTFYNPFESVDPIP